MAKNLTFSPDELTTSMPSISLHDMNGSGKWGTTKLGAGETILQNLKVADGTKYSIRYAISDVNNIFNGSDIEPANAGAIRKGKSLLCKVRHSGRYMVNVGTAEEPVYEFRGEYPVEVGITCKYPNAVVNAQDVYQVLGEAFTALCGDTNSDGAISDHLTKVMSGSFPIK